MSEEAASVQILAASGKERSARRANLKLLAFANPFRAIKAVNLCLFQTYIDGVGI